MAPNPDLTGADSTTGAGVVTFVFTDVVGSTAAWERSPVEMALAMARHDEVIEQVVVDAGGRVVRPRGEGDSRFAVFDAPDRALVAAASIGPALAAVDWPTPEPIVVRCAVHTGVAQQRDDDYYGSAVNRCARLRSIASPGQCLASEVVVELGRGTVGDEVTVVDLGIHWLKDLTQPERVFQVQLGVGPVLSFAPLASLLPPIGRVAPVPTPMTPLVGRGDDLDVVGRLVADPSCRLVTVTGPGGVGKTRFAVEVAQRGAPSFAGGASFVDLSSLRDADEVLPTVAAALGVAERGDGEILDALVDRLGQTASLVVLDNLEQVVAAGPAIAELVERAPVTVVATSRVPLRIRGEREHRLEPLPTDDAVALFVERAQRHRRGFDATAEHLAAIAEVCRRLDGLPLALELAAARTSLLQPAQLLDRLNRQLAVLVGGDRDAPDRQRTLRATIEWSFDLLAPEDQLLLERLGTFAGSFSLESAEQVAGVAPLPDDLLHPLSALVDSSLVRVVEDGSTLRFDLLSSIREFVRDRPVDPEGRAGLADRHGDRMVEVAEGAAAALDGPDHPLAVAELRAEDPDLRQAVEHLLVHRPDDAARLVLALLWYWITEGRLGEGRRMVASVLDAGPQQPRLRARLRQAAGILAWYQDVPEQARPLLERAVDEASALGDDEAAATARCFSAACTLVLEGADVAAPLVDAALDDARRGGWYRAQVQSLSLRAMLAGVAGDLDEEEALHRERLALARARGDRVRTADTLNTLAEVLLDRGDRSGARDAAADALDAAAGSSRITVRDAHLTLGRIALVERDLPGAAASLQRALDLSVEFAQPFELSLCLRGAAVVALAGGDRRAAARLAGAALGLRDPDGDPFPVEADLEAALSAIDDEELSVGLGTPLADALVEAASVLQQGCA